MIFLELGKTLFYIWGVELKDFWRYPVHNSGNSKQVHEHESDQNKEDYKQFRRVYYIQTCKWMTSIFWAHDLLMNLIWASG